MEAPAVATISSDNVWIQLIILTVVFLPVIVFGGLYVVELMKPMKTRGIFDD